MKKHALMIDALLVIGAVIFIYFYFVAPKIAEEKTLDRMREELKKFRDYTWKTDPYHFMYSYDPAPSSDVDAKDEMIERIKHINGQRMQLLRFCCWLVEEDRNRRSRLIGQWMEIMRTDGELPPLAEVKEHIRKLFKGKTGLDVDQRLSEIESNYPVASEPKAVYYNQENTFSKDVFRVMDIFIDKDEPMGLVLFNEKKKFLAFKKIGDIISNESWHGSLDNNVVIRAIGIIWEKTG